MLIGLFRASYDVVTREIFHMLGIRRRAVLVGEGEHLVHLYRTLGSGRSGIDYELLGVVTDEEETDVPLPRLGERRLAAGRARRASGGRADRHRY